MNWLILLVAFNMVGAVIMFADGKNNLLKASSNPEVPLLIYTSASLLGCEQVSYYREIEHIRSMYSEATTRLDLDR